MECKKNHAQSYALITGASSGIGACFARRFWREGYSLILVARRFDRLQELKAELVGTSSSEQNIIIIPTDLSETEHIKALFEKLVGIRISIFINNAGFGDCGYFCETDADKELSMIDVNVKAMHLAMKLALRRMQAQGHGYILNVASSAGLLPGGPYMATYYATKAYVVSLTRAVACELAQSKSPVYVGALCPGPVDTEFNSVANVEFALKGISVEDCVDDAIRQMKKRKTIIVPTMRMKLAMGCGRLLSTGLLVRITAHQQRRKFS